MDEFYKKLSELLSGYFKDNFNKNFDSDTIYIFLIVVFVILIPFIYKLFKFLISKFKNIYNKYLFERNKLYPYYSEIEINNARLNYISQNFQNLSPNREDELIYNTSYVARQNIIKFFLKVFKNKNEKRFFAILADSGMGKTTFSLNLFLKYNNFYRTLFLKNKLNMYLIPLGYPNWENKLTEHMSKINFANSILILDGLDEDKKAINNSKDRLKEIIDLTKDFKYIILTCRTQFFNNEKLEPSETEIPRLGTKKGYYYFEKLYISPFFNEDVKKFVNKKYGILNFSSKKRIAKKVIKSTPYLMARPMLLDFIDDVVKSEKDFYYVYDIYSELIKAWIEREENNLQVENKETFKSNLYTFSYELAKKIYYGRNENGYTVNIFDFEKIASDNNLELSIFEMKTRSLLSRLPSGQYKFSHKSILEYFLANAIFSDFSFKKNFDEEGLDMTINFYNELCFKKYYLDFINDVNEKEKIIVLPELNIKKDFHDFDENLKARTLVIKDLEKKNLKAFRTYKNIEYLEIIDSKISDFEDINCFQNLKKIVIKNSKIDSSISRISELKNINSICIQGAELRDYQINTIRWGNFKCLNEIDFSDNELTSYSFCEKIKNKIILKINNNKIQYFEDFKNIKALEISKNSIKKANINFESEITFLDLSNNELAEININSKFLEYLNVSNNELIDFSINEENRLYNLNVSNNSKIIDDFFKNLKKVSLLKELNLSNTNAKKLDFLKDLINLEKIYLINVDSKKIDFNLPNKLVIIKD